MLAVRTLRQTKELFKEPPHLHCPGHGDVLMIKLKDNSKEQCEKLRDLFMTMKGRVPQALDVEAGADFLHSERSFDVCLTVTLESPEALEEYQKDPYHCNTVKTYVATVREKAVAVDYIV